LFKLKENLRMAVKKSRMGIVIAGLLLGIFIAAIDNTIVATAMGTIVGDLGGLDKFVWVTSAYMVAEMAGMPIFGKLSDMFGRKRFFIFGLIMFLIGSILCGTAHSIVELSIYRAIQGIGGGALVPIAFTILYDIIAPEQRGKMGGLFGAVFGLSSIFGPLLGAYITDYIGWQWIFYINLPLGILAFIFIAFFYKESLQHVKQKIDWWGAATLVGAIVALIFAIELGGNKYAWDSTTILGLFLSFAVLFIAFLFIEARVEEPIISFNMFRNRLFAGSTLVGLFSGAAFIVAAVYIPLYIQGVFGGTATNSGLVLLPMMVSSVVTAATGGVLMNKLSYRSIMLVASIVLLTGIVLLTTLTTETPRFVVTLYMIITGLGIGASFSVLANAAIHHFDTIQRGSANATLAFVRSFGMTVGITIFGIIQRNIFTARMTEAFAGQGSAPTGSVGDPRELLSQTGRAKIPAPVLEKITAALSTSIAHTFVWAIVPAGLALLFVLYMGNDRLIVPGRDSEENLVPAESR
jgi:EmrB/QacA subfamily drug resistance transporter